MVSKLKQLRKNLELLVLAGVLTIGSTGCNKTSENETTQITTQVTTEESTISTEMVVEDTYDFKEISNIIDNNNNLTDEEKTFIKQLQFVFDENHEYMDLDMIKERLSTLEINYSNNESLEGSSDTRGYYSPSKNKIMIYGCNDMKDADIDKFVHEFLHVLQKQSNDFTMELSNEFFSREVVRRLYDEKIVTDEQINKISEIVVEDFNEAKIYGRGYNDYMPLYYTIAELSSEKYLREYQFGCDTKSLIMGIAYKEGVILSSTEAESFIKCLNDSRIYNKETHTYDLISKFDQGDVIEECYNYLDFYFLEKYGHNIKDDLKVAILYYDCRQLGTIIGGSYSPYESEEYDILSNQMIEEAKKQIGEEATTFGLRRTVTPRTYLSKDHLDTSITFNSVPYVTIEIDDNFCNNFKNKLSESNKPLVYEP